MSNMLEKARMEKGTAMHVGYNRLGYTCVPSGIASRFPLRIRPVAVRVSVSLSVRKNVNQLLITPRSLCANAGCWA